MPAGRFRVRVTYDGTRAEGVTTVCTQIAEVEVDPDTGQVTILSMVSAHDVGAVLNPVYLQTQAEGGLVYGLGYALTEELLFEDGKVVNPNLGEYKLPNIRDIPAAEEYPGAGSRRAGALRREEHRRGRARGDRGDQRQRGLRRPASVSTSCRLRRRRCDRGLKP